MKQEKRISKTIEKYDDDWPPSDSAGFFAWFRAKLTDVPECCRSTVQIKISSKMEYDNDCATIEISYVRPETDKEELHRQQKDAAQADSRRAAELRTLAELKAKYGNKP